MNPEYILQALGATVTLLEFLTKMKETLSQTQEWTPEQEDQWKAKLSKLNDSPQWKPRIN